MELKVNRTNVLLASALAGLILSNPNPNDFKEKYGHRSVNREWNFLIFSIYSHHESRYVLHDSVHGDYHREYVTKYLAILNNFIVVSEKQII